MMDYDEKHWSRSCPKVDCRKKACECGLLYKTIPAALGDDSPTSAVAPKNGAYCNSIVEYEANGHIYLYGSDGIPVEIGGEGGGGVSDFDALLNRPKYAGEEMTSETDIPDVTAAVEAEATTRASADSALQASITAETTARTNADTTLQGNITALADRVTTAESDIDSIEEVIPAQASAQNQLADKDFVNSSVATNTANYISNNGQPFSSVAELEAYSGTLTNNDYAFVTGMDAQGNTFYDRYKYNANTGEWAFEYELNNSSFTANQWATINSGITSGDVTKLSNLADIQTIGTGLTLTNGELSATSTGPTVVQTTGTSTTDVMSQNATTSMIYADPGTRTKIQIGDGADAGLGANSVVIGHNAKTGAGSINNVVAIGTNSLGVAAAAVVVGYDAKVAVASNGGIAIGNEAKANAMGSIALGQYSSTSSVGEMNIGSSDTSRGYSNSNYRLLTGLYDPQTAHDAANKQYVDTAVAGAGVAEINATDWSALWQ